MKLPNLPLHTIEKMAEEADRTQLSDILKTVIDQKRLYNIREYSRVSMIITEHLLKLNKLKYREAFLGFTGNSTEYLIESSTYTYLLVSTSKTKNFPAHSLDLNVFFSRDNWLSPKGYDKCCSLPSSLSTPIILQMLQSSI